MNLSRPLLSTLLVSALATTTAVAKTFEVSKGGKFKTIQSAVDAAGPGDTVRVKSGTYRENVFIPANRTGITIDGEGKVIIDALPDGGVPAGPGLQVHANGAKIRDLIIKNARSTAGVDGHGFAGFALDLRIEDLVILSCQKAGIFLDASDGARIEDVRIVACQVGVNARGDGIRIEDVECERFSSSAIIVEGNDARVLSCSVKSVGTFGVHIQGNGGRAIGNKVVGSADEGVFVEGDDARIEKNEFRIVLDFAVRVIGDRAKVVKNKVRRNMRSAMQVEGADHVVLENSIVDVDGNGIISKGPGARIESNEVSFTYGNSLTVDGSNFKVLKNELTGALDGYAAVLAHAGASGVIRENEVRDGSGAAVYLSETSVGITIVDNVAEDCGHRGIVTYRIAGNGHTVTDNVAKRGGDDGFRVIGMGHVLIGNRAIDNLADGIDLQSGSFYEVRECVAQKNGGEGIENSADNVLIADNIMKKNRIDLANDNGVNVTFSGNEFETGGPKTKPELD